MTKVLDNQSIFDLLLQESGGLNNTARVLRDNGLDFNEELLPGSVLNVVVLESEKIKENYELIRFKPNNSDEVGGNYIFEDGIHYDFEDGVHFEFED